MIDQFFIFDKTIAVRIGDAAFWGYFPVSLRSITGNNFWEMSAIFGNASLSTDAKRGLIGAYRLLGRCGTKHCTTGDI